MNEERLLTERIYRLYDLAIIISLSGSVCHSLTLWAHWYRCVATDYDFEALWQRKKWEFGRSTSSVVEANHEWHLMVLASLNSGSGWGFLLFIFLFKKHIYPGAHIQIWKTLFYFNKLIHYWIHSHIAIIILAI